MSGREKPEAVTCADKHTQCADYDEDCYGIEDKVHCYLYDPTRGMCPFLSSHSKHIKDPPQ